MYINKKIIGESFSNSVPFCKRFFQRGPFFKEGLFTGVGRHFLYPLPLIPFPLSPPYYPLSLICYLLSVVCYLLFLISYCQAQFQFSTSPVQLELSTALILIISTPTPTHPTHPRDSSNETLLGR